MWIFYALAASVTWGLMYALSEQLYKKISVLSTIAISALLSSFVLLVISAGLGVLRKDMTEIMASNKLIYLIIGQSIVLLAAELFIGFSIASKNATVSGIIEMSYPVFIAFFTYFLFDEKQFNPSILVGAVFILFGIIIIGYFNS